MIPAYLIAALNTTAKERQSKPFHFVSMDLPVLAVTPAEVNVANGKVIIPKGQYLSEQLIVTNFRLRVNTAGVGATNIYLRTTDATPVLIATFATAQLTTGAILEPSSAGVTLGAGFCAKLNPGTGIVLCSSANATPATATGSFTLDLIPLKLTAR